LAERFSRAIDSVKSYRNRPKGFVARVDYWVYLPGDELPSQEQIMHRMLADNPHKVKGVSPIGNAEAIFFSDVRTHIALVLKERNPRIFRAGLFPDTIYPTEPQLAAMDLAKSLVKVSFVSEQPLKETTHTGFALHAADAIADLANGTLIYDRVSEHLWTRDELTQALSRDPKAQSTDLQTTTLWMSQIEGGWVETRGLRKIGFPEIKTAKMERDQQVLIQAVIDQAVEKVWECNQIPAELTVTLFEDEFRVVVAKRGKDFTEVKILRIGEL
jgi:hypothetical protein